VEGAEELIDVVRRVEQVDRDAEVPFPVCGVDAGPGELLVALGGGAVAAGEHGEGGTGLGR